MSTATADRPTRPTTDPERRAYDRATLAILAVNHLPNLDETLTGKPLESREYALAAGILDARNGRPLAYPGAYVDNRRRIFKREYTIGHLAAQMVTVLISNGYTSTAGIERLEWNRLVEAAGLTGHTIAFPEEQAIISAILDHTPVTV